MPVREAKIRIEIHPKTDAAAPARRPTAFALSHSSSTPARNNEFWRLSAVSQTEVADSDDFKLTNSAGRAVRERANIDQDVLNPQIVECFFLDLAPPVSQAETPVAFVARTKKSITIGWVREIVTAEEEDRTLVLGLISSLRSFFEDMGPKKAFKYIASTFSNTLRVRPIKRLGSSHMKCSLRTLQQELGSGNLGLYTFPI